jgi:hypothetical protein
MLRVNEWGDQRKKPYLLSGPIFIESIYLPGLKHCSDHSLSIPAWMGPPPLVHRSLYMDVSATPPHVQLQCVLSHLPVSRIFLHILHIDPALTLNKTAQ